MCKLFIWKGKNIWSHIFLILHWHFVRVFIGMVVWDNITRGYYCVLFPFVCCFTPQPLTPPPHTPTFPTRITVRVPVNSDHTAWSWMHRVLPSLYREAIKVIHWLLYQFSLISMWKYANLADWILELRADFWQRIWCNVRANLDTIPGHFKIMR
jgi:hypothetical protein